MCEKTCLASRLVTPASPRGRNCLNRCFHRSTEAYLDGFFVRGCDIDNDIMKCQMKMQRSGSKGKACHQKGRGAPVAARAEAPRILDSNTYKARIKGMWDRSGPQYDSADTFHKSLAEKLVAFASPLPGQHILDIATGTGMVALPIADVIKGSAGKVTGIDISDSMLDEVHLKQHLRILIPA